jgi:hypothetical protein
MNAYQIFDTSTSDENLYATAQDRADSWFWEDECEVMIFKDGSYLSFDKMHQYKHHGYCKTTGADTSMRHCY